MKNIVVCGDAIIDKYIWGSVNRMSPEDDTVAVLDVSRSEVRLGGCLNTACNIKSLSGQDTAVLVSSIISEYTWLQFPSKKITKGYCHLLPNHKEPSPNEIIKERIVNEKTRKQLVRIDNRRQFSAADVHQYEKCFGYDFPFYDAIVVSDYEKGTINSNTLEKLKKYTEKPIFVDSKKHLLTSFPSNCIFKVNNKEFGLLKDWQELNTLIVTKGPGGCDLYQKGKLICCYPTQKIDSVDVTGAGDVFLAGLVAKYVEKNDLDESIKFANLAAAISVTFFGTATITREMVEYYNVPK